MENLQINGLTNNLAYLEAIGLSKCFEAYANSFRRDIIEIGFNDAYGCVYIVLDNSITICSTFGRAVEYLITLDSGEELLFDTIDEAENNLITDLNNY